MTLPGGEAVCMGYHVWSKTRPWECTRCGFVALEEITTNRTDGSREGSIP